MPKQQKRARTDGRGTVRVSVHLEAADGARIKGNIARTFRVSAATVTDVASAVERIFEKQEAYRLKQ